MGSLAHTYAPAYTDEEFPTIARYSSHVTFNSLNQFERLYPVTRQAGHPVSCGLRINPEFSDVETDLYNPCAPGSRLGIVADMLGEKLPDGIEGLHFHTLCESRSTDLEKTLAVVEEKFGKYFSQIKWLNMGGGHLMTHEEYDTEHLITLLRNFNAKYPHLQLILEPGSTFAWQTGELVSSVVDIVENRGIKTAMALMNRSSYRANYRLFRSTYSDRQYSSARQTGRWYSSYCQFASLHSESVQAMRPAEE